MMDIVTASGHIIQIDYEDYEIVQPFTWRIAAMRKGNQYAQTSVYLGKQDGKKTYATLRMHRLIMSMPLYSDLFVDHIDGDGLNNQKNNLRICTSRQNSHNTGPRVGEYRWVFPYKGKWMARVKNNYLGLFANAIDAAKAANAEAIKQYGKFARLNNV